MSPPLPPHHRACPALAGGSSRYSRPSTDPPTRRAASDEVSACTDARCVHMHGRSPCTHRRPRAKPEGGEAHTSGAHASRMCEAQVQLICRTHASYSRVALGPPPPVTPATLLVHDETGTYCALVREEQSAHGALLRAALRTSEQVAYLWAEDVHNDHGQHCVRVHTDATAEPPDGGW